MGACTSAPEGKPKKNQPSPAGTIDDKSTLQKGIKQQKQQSVLRQDLVQHKVQSNIEQQPSHQQLLPQASPSRILKNAGDPTISMMLQAANDPNLNAFELKNRLSESSRHLSSNIKQSKVDQNNDQQKQSIKQSALHLSQNPPQQCIKSVNRINTDVQRSGLKSKSSSISQLVLPKNIDKDNQITQQLENKRYAKSQCRLNGNTETKIQNKMGKSNLQHKHESQLKKIQNNFDNQSGSKMQNKSKMIQMEIKESKIENKIQRNMESKMGSNIGSKIQSKMMNGSKVNIKKKSNIASNGQSKMGIAINNQQPQNKDEQFFKQQAQLYSFNNKANPTSNPNNPESANIYSSLLHVNTQIGSKELKPYSSVFINPGGASTDFKTSTFGSRQVKQVKQVKSSSFSGKESSILKNQDYVPNQSIVNFGPANGEFQYDFNVNIAV